MAVLTIFGHPDDGWLVSEHNGSYTTARAGTVAPDYIPDITGGNLIIGQNNPFGTFYECYESFILFDTSPLNTLGVPVAATLLIYPMADVSTVDFTIEARLYDWSAGGLLGNDFVGGASIGSKPLLATWWTGGFSDSYAVFTSNGTALRDNLNLTGFTGMLLNSDRQRVGTAPTTGNGEYVYLHSADEAGTTKDPKLVVTYAPHGRWGGISR